jgi:hypothetical protein
MTLPVEALVAGSGVLHAKIPFTQPALFKKLCGVAEEVTALSSIECRHLIS